MKLSLTMFAFVAVVPSTLANLRSVDIREGQKTLEFLRGRSLVESKSKFAALRSSNERNLGKKKMKMKRRNKMKNKKPKFIVPDPLPENCKVVKKKVDDDKKCPKIPKKCSGVSASWSGDPHMKTFDKVKYDCMGEGEFDVVKSLDGGFSLQGRFIKFDDKRRPTVTSAVVMDTGDGEPTIQINVPDKEAKSCEPILFINGTKTSFDNGDYVEGITIKKTKTKNEDGYIFYYDNTEIKLEVAVKKSKKNGCVLRADLCIPDCYHRMTAKGGEGFVGLLGTPDGNKKNDWTGKDGKAIKLQPKKGDAAYNYCTKNWCIEDPGESLFVYESGESFDGFNQCDLGPDVETGKCVENPLSIKDLGENFGQELLDTCVDEDIPCLTDGCVGGIESARDYVAAHLNQVDKQCGRLIFQEDFEEESLKNKGDSKYGEILKKKKSKDKKKAKSAHAKTQYLSLHKESSEIKLPLEIPDGTAQVSVEFMFFEIGNWENKKGKKDTVYVDINNKELDLGSFKGKKKDGDASGAKYGIAWERTMVSKQANLGFSNGDNKDQVHKYVFKIPPEHFESGILDFGIRVSMTEAIKDESAGVDDIKVHAFKSTCTIDCDGATVVFEDFEDDDDSDWGIMEPLPGGHPFLGPLTANEDSFVEKTFDLTEFADKAEIDFLLYTFGDWGAGGTLMVSVGDSLLDLGQITNDEDVGFKTNGEAEDELGERGVVEWERTTTAVSADIIGNGNQEDSMHEVTIIVPSDYITEEGLLTVVFWVECEYADLSFEDFIDEEEEEKTLQRTSQQTRDRALGGSTCTAGIDNFQIVVWPEKSKCNKKKQEQELKKTKCPAKEKKDNQCNDKCYECTLECAPTAPPSPVPPPGSPTSSPTGPPIFTSGDPHIRGWKGESYDYHGECDLVMLQNPDFNNGQGLHIHIRTKIQRWWSYIESCSIKIGKDTLEVKSGIQDRKYWVNGVEGSPFDTSGQLGFTIGGFSGRFRQLHDSVIQYKIFLPDNQEIFIRSVKDMLRVEIDYPLTKDFENSNGLMGTFGSGALLGRNGTEFKESDTDAFGQEWQVNANDPQLFHSPEGPQYPEQCKMPDLSPGTEEKRRLEGSISREEAEIACAPVHAEFSDCVYDVMATNDVDMANGY